MVIIDNKKDYYDYLVSYYGRDNYVVYDRRKSNPLGRELAGSLLSSSSMVEDIIGENSYLCLLMVGEKSFPVVFKRYIERDQNSLEERLVKTELTPWEGFTFKNKWRNPKDYYDRILRIGQKYLSEEAPLLFLYGNLGGNFYFDRIVEVIKNPILKDTPFTSMVSPQAVWVGIYNYLLSQKEPKIIDTRTDVQHLESAGFDKKTSFRNIKNG